MTEPPNPSPYGPPQQGGQGVQGGQGPTWPGAQNPYPPQPGYPQQPSYPQQPGYPPQQGFPPQPTYPPQPGYPPPPNYPPPGYAGYPPQGYPGPSYATPPPQQPAPRRLFWSWIVSLGLGVAAGIACIAFAVGWLQTASRLGIPANTSATYGTVTSVDGNGDLRVSVPAGAPLITRTVTHSFNNTNTNTSTTHFGEGFTAVVVGAPALTPGVDVSFYFTDSDDHGTYLPVAPSRIRSFAKVPAGVVASGIIAFVFGLTGVILLIVWIVAWRRRRQPGVAMYAPPGMYWPPGNQPR